MTAIAKTREFKPRVHKNGGWHGGPRHWRFIMKVVIPEDRNACWGWTGGRDRDGYPKFADVRAHRYAYEFLTGKTIPAGMMVCHKCDNPTCTNPRHLFVGTGRDNALDREAKGRGVRGNRHGSATPPEKVALIHAAIRGGMKRNAAAKQFGISPAQARLIDLELTWHFRADKPWTSAALI